MVSGVGPVIAGFVCSGITLVFVSLRLYTRLFVSHNPGIDDALVALSFVFAAAEAPIMVFQKRYGMGMHAKDIPLPMLIKQERVFWASTWIYILSIICSKLGILTQYLRIFTTRRTRIVTWIMCVFTTTCCVVCLIIGIFMCIPVAKFWDSRIPGRCIDYYGVWYLMAAMNIFTDIGIIAIPIPTVIRMQMPNRQKLSLAFTFAVGGFGCVASMVRLYYITFLQHNRDVTFYNANAALWSIIELNMVIICACMIALHTLLASLVRKVRRAVSARGTGHSDSSYYQDGSCHSRFSSNRKTTACIWAGKPHKSHPESSEAMHGTDLKLPSYEMESVHTVPSAHAANLSTDTIKVSTRIELEESRSRGDSIHGDVDEQPRLDKRSFEFFFEGTGLPRDLVAVHIV